MPEESFEQQARNITERFSMEPKETVWQHVEAAIAPEKRKRRILVWWWLLPLCIAGGAAVLFMNNKNTLLQARTVPVTVKQKVILPDNGNVAEKKEKTIGKQQIISSGRLNSIKRDNIDKETKKEDKQAIILETNKNDNIITASENHADGNERVWEGTKISDTVAHSFYPSSQTKELIAKYKQAVAAADSSSNDNQSLLSQEQKKVLFSYDKSADSLPVNGEHADRQQPDTSPANPGATNILKDSLQRQSDTTSVPIRKKKQDYHSWRVGVVAEIGISSWGNSLLQIFGSSEAKSNNNLAAIPSGNVNSGTDTSFATVYQNAKKGIDAGVGIVIRKSLRHNLYVSGQFAYRYQEYGVNHFVKDSLVVNNEFLLTTNYPAGEEDYHLHFANIFTGISWQFLTGKKIALSVETGLDNSLLMRVKQDTLSVSSSQFSSRIVENHTARDFYRWQPHANVSLPVSFAGNNFHLQVSPFARFGLHTFRKNGGSYKDNHLVSAGIQAIYFFK